MTSPPVNVCSRGPHGPGSDCPLWDARERIALQRSIEADGAARAQMSALVWADMNRGFRRPGSSPTRPVPIEVRPTKALSVSIAETVTEAKKEVLQHA
jgi:hypothetical protein